MAIFRFDEISDISIKFNADSDIISLSGKASDYLVTDDANGNAVLVRGSKSLVLSGTKKETLSNANLLIAGSDSRILIGDDSKAAQNDALAQGAGDVLDLVGTNSPARESDNLIYGLDGGDTITAGNGNNIIFGGRGVIDKTDGSDTIIIDGVTTTSGTNTIFANAGDDTLLVKDPVGAGKTLYFWGGLGNDDVLSMNAQGTQIIYGNAGADTVNISGSTGTAILYGGNGSIDSVDGADVLIGGLGNTTIYGNAGNDSIVLDDFSTNAAQVIYAGLGDDTISGDADGTGSTGNLAIFGNGGADAIDISSHKGEVTVFGGNGTQDTADGADTITLAGLSGLNARIYGNAGADSISMTSAEAASTARLFAGLGADKISVSGARSVTSFVEVAGNEGNDTITVNDTALVEDATLHISGFEEKDTLELTLNTGDATDIAVSGLGVSLKLENKAGHGHYEFTGFTGNLSATNVKLADGSVLVTNGGDKSSSLSGTANNDQLIAGRAGDTLSGAGGDDLLIGGDSGDSLDGGAGRDTILGNEGNDTITAGDSGLANDNIADNVLDGGDGADSIKGSATDDSILGGSGHDTLYGGAGIDTLTGGLGNDVYEYDAADLNPADTQTDIIKDAFNSGVDRFAFKGLDNAALRGSGTVFTKTDASAAQNLDANTGMLVMTNRLNDFSKNELFSKMSGVADDMAVGDSLYVMASNGTDARLAKVTNVAGNGLSSADDLVEFVARLNDVSDTHLTLLSAGNFTDFG